MECKDGPTRTWGCKQCAVCGMQWAVGGMQWAVGRMPWVVGGCAVCSVQCAVCSVQGTGRSGPRAVGGCAACSVLTDNVYHESSETTKDFFREAFGRHPILHDLETPPDH